MKLPKEVVYQILKDMDKITQDTIDDLRKDRLFESAQVLQDIMDKSRAERHKKKR